MGNIGSYVMWTLPLLRREHQDANAIRSTIVSGCAVIQALTPFLIGYPFLYGRSIVHRASHIIYPIRLGSSLLRTASDSFIDTDIV